MVKPIPTPLQIRRALVQIATLALAGAVQLTGKALGEAAALEPPADIDDVIVTLLGLTAADFAQQLASSATGEPLWVFLPPTEFGNLYIKVAIRTHCVVISFHQQVPV